MSYALGVDLGTTYSAAAIADGSGVRVFALGSSALAIPSIVFMREDGTLLVGEAAERRAMVEPARAAREFKRRLGDPTPIVLGGTPFGAEALMARVLSFVIARVSEERGEAPSRIVLSHPATYGPYKLDLMREVARLADAPNVMLLSEPQAAAIHYSTMARVPAGDLIAVFDFGGGTLDVAVVRKTRDSFELLGEPQGMERFGGIDIDEAVLAHVIESLGERITSLPRSDPATRLALVRLRDDCRRAKESLSTDTETVIPVLLPTLHTEVRLTRAEFEAMLQPRLAETTQTLDRAVRTAGVSLDQVARVLLVGGSSRIPLVAEAVRRASGRPIAVDANPKHAISLGAAAAGVSSQLQSASTAEPARPLRAIAPTPLPAMSGTLAAPPERPVPETSHPVVVAPRAAPARRPTRLQRTQVVGAVLAVVALFLVWPRSPAAAPQGAGNVASFTPASSDPSARATPSPFGDFRLALQPGTYWEYGWDKVTTSSGVSPTNRSGRFRISLGEGVDIKGKVLYSVGTEKVSGDELTFAPTRWAYLGIDGNKLIGSVDGTSIRVVLDAELGLQPGGGFFDEPIAEDRLLTLGARAISNNYASGPAVALTQSTEAGKCQNFTGIGTVCSTNREASTRIQYFRAGVGPIGYFFFGSVVTSSGGSSVTTNIGLITHDLAASVRATVPPSPTRTPTVSIAARASVSPVPRASATPAAGLVRVTDDTRTASVDIPREWTTRLTSPINDSKTARILASTSLQGFQDLEAPGVLLSIWSDAPKDLQLTQVLDVMTGQAPTGCEIKQVPIVWVDGVATASLWCDDESAILYYLTWVPKERADRLVILLLQIPDNAAARYESYFNSVDRSVIVYR